MHNDIVKNKIKTVKENVGKNLKNQNKDLFPGKVV